MANQLFVNPFPYGVDVTQQIQELNGSVALAGSSVATGEPINWDDLISGVGYNEVNFAGNGVHGSGSALVTAITAATPDAASITCTGASNFNVGESVKFKGCTSTIGLLLNGNSYVVTAVTAGTSFVIASALTGDGSSEVGLAVVNKPVRPLLASNGPALTATVSAISASGTTLTVTAANAFLPGSGVVLNVATGSLGPKLAGLLLPVIQSTSTAFTATMPSALTGSTGTGTVTGNNPPQPFDVEFHSALASGYEYQYSQTTGVLFVKSGTSGTLVGTLTAPALTMDSYTPGGTNTAPTITTATGNPATAPIGVITGALAQTSGASGITGVQAPAFTGTAHVLTGSVAAPVLSGSSVSAGPLASLSAAAYPAGVLGDVIKFSAKFIKS